MIKEEMAHIPFSGRALRHERHIFVKRDYLGRGCRRGTPPTRMI
jgi:hypothetical protein